MKIRKISIADHAYIGTGAVIAGDAVVEEWGELKDLSYLQEGKIIRSREIWNGSPAEKESTRPIQELTQPLEVTNGQLRRHSWLYVFLLLVLPFTVLIPLFPVIYIINELDNHADDYDFTYMVYMPLLTLAYILLYIIITAFFSRILLFRIKPGKFPVHGGLYIRKWLADQLMSLSLIILHPLYATVYVSTFFRLLGAKIGRNAEISTASNVTHTLLKIGTGAFVADAVILGEADIRGQQLILEQTIIGNNSFIGNSAVIPQGYTLPDNNLIGVLSTPPASERMEQETFTDWFGSPPIALPKRQQSQEFPPSLTIAPSRIRFFSRAVVELIRIIIPETVIICLSILLIAYGHDLLVDYPLWEFTVLFPLHYLAFFGVPVFLITAAFKWTFVGKYKSRQMPIWSHKVWLSEAITVIYEALAVPFLLSFLRGTPWLPLFFRVLGVKTGKRVYMDTTDITEFDMVTIEDDVALNFDCGPQTHLFEDRVMKVGNVTISERSSVGVKSIILYDTMISKDVEIEPLSLVMKGEKLASETRWNGSPVRPA